jgi:hypothetical protein
MIYKEVFIQYILLYESMIYENETKYLAWKEQNV